MSAAVPLGSEQEEQEQRLTNGRSEDRNAVTFLSILADQIKARLSRSVDLISAVGCTLILAIKQSLI